MEQTRGKYGVMMSQSSIGDNHSDIDTAKGAG